MKIYKIDSEINMSVIDIKMYAIEEVLVNIHMALKEFQYKGIFREDLSIACSELFVRFFEQYQFRNYFNNGSMSLATFSFGRGEFKIFGIKCIPNYENNIVIFYDKFSFCPEDNNLVIKIECENFFNVTKSKL